MKLALISEAISNVTARYSGWSLVVDSLAGDSVTQLLSPPRMIKLSHHIQAL